jgi:ABC-2 type transport system permease protein
MTALRHSGYLLARDLRALLRQPWFAAITLVQPAIWLLLFGSLFKKVVQIPGFHSGSYIQFLAPGVVVMTALFSAGWNGMAFIQEIERGVADRLLVSPVSRGALIAGRVGQSVVSVIIQTLVIVALALVLGAPFAGGVGGVIVLILLACLLGVSFAALSNGLALLARQEETLIALVTFVTLPLTFLSTALIQKSLMPSWMRVLADINPVNWAIEAGRSAAMIHTDWGLVGTRLGMLLALALVCGTFATRAFRSYQRSI